MFNLRCLFIGTSNSKTSAHTNSLSQPNTFTELCIQSMEYDNFGHFIQSEMNLFSLIADTESLLCILPRIQTPMTFHLTAQHGNMKRAECCSCLATVGHRFGLPIRANWKIWTKKQIAMRYAHTHTESNMQQNSFDSLNNFLLVYSA